MQVLGDFMRILLEVINCILSLNLGRNPELVYALLHKQEVFEQLRPHAGFSELIENLQVRTPTSWQAGTTVLIATGGVACVHHCVGWWQHCSVGVALDVCFGPCK
jgi:hypothetical protein